MQMLDKMEQMKITQKQLAERMNCSQQYISKILKGKENLSLETLTKIENALELLKEEEKRLVNFRYFSNRKKAPSWLDVGEEIGYSDKKCRAMRNDIINRIKTLI